LDIELEQIFLFQIEIGTKRNVSNLLQEILERKGTFLFTSRTKLERRNVSIFSRIKMEQKGTLLFSPGKSGTKRNKSFFLSSF
jgi:hypothetical protein